jgi:hypothetical protein
MDADENDCGTTDGEEGLRCGERRGEGIQFLSDLSLCGSGFQFGNVEKR